MLNRGMGMVAELYLNAQSPYVTHGQKHRRHVYKEKAAHVLQRHRVE